MQKIYEGFWEMLEDLAEDGGKDTSPLITSYHHLVANSLPIVSILSVA